MSTHSRSIVALTCSTQIPACEKNIKTFLRTSESEVSPNPLPMDHPFRYSYRFEFILIFMFNVFNVPEAEFDHPVDWHSRIVLKAIKRKGKIIID